MQSTAKNQNSYLHDPKWATGVSRLIKAQMAATGITYAELSKRLKGLGTTQSPENLRVKINRGNFGRSKWHTPKIQYGEIDLNSLMGATR